MSRREEVRRIAKRLAVIDQEIEKLESERTLLERQFDSLVPDDAPAGSNGSIQGPSESTSARMLRYMANHPDRIFTPAGLSKEIGGNRKVIRNVLLRFAKVGDRRIINVGGRGNYKFNSLTKENHA